MTGRSYCSPGGGRHIVKLTDFISIPLAVFKTNHSFGEHFILFANKNKNNSGMKEKYDE